MRRIAMAVLLGAAATVALAALAACDDDTTVNTAFKDAGSGEGGEGGKSEGGTNEGGPTSDAGATTDANDDGG
jgi:hypothetical protein